MSTTSPSILVVLAVTSDTAFLNLEGIPNLIRSFDFLASSFPSQTVVVTVSHGNAPRVRDLLDKKRKDHELLVCQPLEPDSFLLALKPLIGNFGSVMIHDASRPLTSQGQFESVIAAFSDDIDAVRPAMPFTETLKILSADSIIKETLDRSTVLRISTPELIRVSAIDIHGSDCGWFLPLKKDAHTTHIEGNPDGSRINTPADRDLMELHQI